MLRALAMRGSFSFKVVSHARPRGWLMTLRCHKDQLEEVSARRSEVL